MLESFKIGHYTSEADGTGVTVILAEEGATGGVSVRGSAPATRETDLLRPGNAVEKVNAIVLSGGSAFGLNSAGGVMRYLKAMDKGFKTNAMRIPIVCGASLYDLDYKSTNSPTMKDGHKACLSAYPENFACGAIGAGTGATVGKIMGELSMRKSGLGVSYQRYGEVEIACIVAVNAFGNIYDYRDGSLIKGAQFFGKDIDIIQAIAETDLKQMAGSNTTIGCIITNAILTKEQANKLADIVHDGYAMTIRPTHTMLDGDAIFAMASCEKECNFLLLSSIAPTIMADAIIKAVSSVE